jgi:hypothetical protein
VGGNGPLFLESVREVKERRPGERVSFRARVLRAWETGGRRMCLVGDPSGLMRVELGLAPDCREGASYEFRNAAVQAYPGGWHSLALDDQSEAAPLAEEIETPQPPEYIERTYRILAGVQRKKARKEGRLPPWRHPAGRDR